MKEIERKWLVTEIPDLNALVPLHYELHFLFISSEVELRIQHKND